MKNKKKNLRKKKDNQIKNHSDSTSTSDKRFFLKNFLLKPNIGKMTTFQTNYPKEKEKRWTDNKHE